MALVRATQLGVGPHGGKIKPGDVFEHAGPLASWMELVEGKAPSPAPSKAAAEKPAPAAAEAAESETQTEAAADAPSADAKRALRNRKPAKEAD